MAYVKSKTVSALGGLLNYCRYQHDENHLLKDEQGQYIEREGLLMSGIDCNPDSARQEFKACKIMWDKVDKVQAYSMIQSFEGRECTPEQAHEAGIKLAKKLAPGHQAIVFTHSDSEGGNIHNHIIFNSVNMENGLKFNGHEMWKPARQLSDEICNDMNLSIIHKGHGCDVRYTRAEDGLQHRDGQSWKVDMRNAIADAAEQATDWKEFGQMVKAHGITFDRKMANDRALKKKVPSIVFKDAEGHKARAKGLGDAYNVDALEQKFTLNRTLQVGSVRADAEQTEQNKTMQNAQIEINAVKIERAEHERQVQLRQYERQLEQERRARERENEPELEYKPRRRGPSLGM